MSRPARIAAPPPIRSPSPMLRGAVSQLAGRGDDFVARGRLPVDEIAPVAALSRHGTLTPEHVIHNKPAFPRHPGQDPAPADFAAEYGAYVARGDAGLTPLPPHPHWAILANGVRILARRWRGRASRPMSPRTCRRCGWPGGLAAGRGWTRRSFATLNTGNLAGQAARRRPAASAGRTGGAGFGCCDRHQACHRQRCATGRRWSSAGHQPEVARHMDRPAIAAWWSTNDRTEAVDRALAEVVRDFGGIDIQCRMSASSAPMPGSGAQGRRLGPVAGRQPDLTGSFGAAVPFPAAWRGALGGVFIGSRNVMAPGAGAAAYSVSKAGLTQLMRVAALELAPEGDHRQRRPSRRGLRHRALDAKRRRILGPPLWPDGRGIQSPAT